MKRRVIDSKVDTLVIRSNNLILTLRDTDHHKLTVIKECNNELMKEQERLTDMMQLKQELKKLRKMIEKNEREREREAREVEIRKLTQLVEVIKNGFIFSICLYFG